ncbi:hypothetical protein Bbelb_393190 [Branchiostoma belcheri]|nr:hypothetical protein Bbelb_393190 [Branchiostoma belcheri]
MKIVNKNNISPTSVPLVPPTLQLRREEAARTLLTQMRASHPLHYMETKVSVRETKVSVAKTKVSVGETTVSVGETKGSVEKTKSFVKLDMLAKPFTIEEYIAVKSKLKLGKAAYPDGIPPEALKLCDFHDIMLLFANKLFLDDMALMTGIIKQAQELLLRQQKKNHSYYKWVPGELAATKKFKADQKAVQSIPTVAPGWVYNKTAADLFR